MPYWFVCLPNLAMSSGMGEILCEEGNKRGIKMDEGSLGGG